MSVLFILPSKEIGGAETKFYNLIKHMDGITGVLLTHSAAEEYFSPLGIKMYLFEDYACHEPTLLSIKNIFRYARAVSETVKKEKISCVVGIMHSGSFYASVAKDVFRFKVPHLGTIEGNLTAFFNSNERSPSMKEKFLLSYLLRRPYAVVVPSEGVRDDLVENFDISEGRVKVIHNGVDVQHVLAASGEMREIVPGYNGKIVLTACRLNAQKDFHTLLMAFREVRSKIESKLIIVGDGELKSEIVRETLALGIEDDVIMAGFQLNPFPFFKAADVFVLSSFYEGFGNVIVEAMALGVPVVATSCPSGPSEIIQDGINGFLVPVKDHVEMAKKILNLMTDSGLRDRVSAMGRRRAERYHIFSVAEEFKKLLLSTAQDG